MLRETKAFFSLRYLHYAPVSQGTVSSKHLLSFLIRFSSHQQSFTNFDCLQLPHSVVFPLVFIPITYVPSRNISTTMKKSSSNTHTFFPFFHLLFSFKIQKSIQICPVISVSRLAIFQSQNANRDAIKHISQTVLLTLF